jgi:hypothetical protein
MAVYAWKTGARLTIDAQFAGERLEQLKTTHSTLTADIVVSDARNSDSPLHDGFEWDNTIAAEQYRLQQARYILRSVVVKDMPGHADEEIRAFVVIKNENSDNSYVPTQIALSDDEMRQKVLMQAHRDLEALERKYNDLSELAEILQNARNNVMQLVSAGVNGGKW